MIGGQEYSSGRDAAQMPSAEGHPTAGALVNLDDSTEGESGQGQHAETDFIYDHTVTDSLGKSGQTLLDAAVAWTGDDLYRDLMNRDCRLVWGNLAFAY